MNKTHLLLLVFFSHIGCGSGLSVIDEKKLIIRGSRMYQPKLFKFFGTEKPYNGVAIKYFERDGKSIGKECEGNYKNGRRDGVWTYYYEPVQKIIKEGIKESEGPYRIGYRDGFTGIRTVLKKKKENLNIVKELVNGNTMMKVARPFLSENFNF